MILSFLGIGFDGADLPHSVRFEQKRSMVCQKDPQQVVSEFLREQELRRAKHYLKSRGIKPWTNWDYSNKAFAWKK